MVLRFRFDTVVNKPDRRTFGFKMVLWGRRSGSTWTTVETVFAESLFHAAT